VALTNAEKQKRWRDRRNALAKQALKLHGQKEANPPSQLTAELEPLLQGLFEEGKKSMARMSPGTVARLACLLERVLVTHGIVPNSKRTGRPGKEWKPSTDGYVTKGQ
jgi:hypothetical protein